MLAFFRGIDLLFGQAIAILLAFPILLIAGTALLRSRWGQKQRRQSSNLTATIQQLPQALRTRVETFRRKMLLVIAVAAAVCLGSFLLYIYIPFSSRAVSQFFWSYGEEIVWSVAIMTYTTVLLRMAGTSVLIFGLNRTVVVSWGPVVVFALMAVCSCVVALIASIFQGHLQDEFVFGAIYIALAGAGLGILIRFARAGIRPAATSTLSTSTASILFVLCALELTVLGWLLWRQW